MKDKNKIDPYYLKTHNEKAVNYNRDIESFPILNQILKAIMGTEIYDSPTSMGINNVGNAIVDDFAVQTASMQEIERRHIKHRKMFEEGKLSKDSLRLSIKLLKKSQKIYKKLEKLNKI